MRFNSVFAVCTKRTSSWNWKLQENSIPFHIQCRNLNPTKPIKSMRVIIPTSKDDVTDKEALWNLYKNQDSQSEGTLFRINTALVVFLLWTASLNLFKPHPLPALNIIYLILKSKENFLYPVLCLRVNVFCMLQSWDCCYILTYNWRHYSHQLSHLKTW